MKKRCVAFFCALILLISFAGCARSQTVENGKLNVVATIFPPYDFARQVGQDRINLTLLIPPGGESHTYEPTPQDMITIQNADLFLYTGGENDTWLDGILANLEQFDGTVIRMVDCVDTVAEEVVEGMQSPGGHAHSHAEAEQEPDEHVWTAPLNALQITEAIAAALMEKDPENRSFYQAQLEAYAAQLRELDASFRAFAQTLNKRELIFGDRFPLRYFAQTYDFTYYAAFPGCSAESEPSARTIAFLIDKAKADQIGTIFYLEFSNHQAADTIAQAVGARTALFHSCHNVTPEELERGETYLSLMKQNLETLKEAFT